jgi:predicted nucleic acid-binding protein
VDDYKARKVAENLGIEITGTIGVIVNAKINGVISSVKPLLQKMKETDFRISDDIIRFAIHEAGE